MSRQPCRLKSLCLQPKATVTAWLSPAGPPQPETEEGRVGYREGEGPSPAPPLPRPWRKLKADGNKNGLPEHPQVIREPQRKCRFRPAEPGAATAGGGLGRRPASLQGHLLGVSTRRQGGAILGVGGRGRRMSTRLGSGHSLKAPLSLQLVLLIRCRCRCSETHELHRPFQVTDGAQSSNLPHLCLVAPAHHIRPIRREASGKGVAEIA